MDATTPFRRTLCSAGLALLIAAGCRSADAPRGPVARPQMPADPLGPIAPGSTPPTPVAGQLPVQGRPVAVGYRQEWDAKPGSVAASLPDGDPRIKVVAIVGAGNIVTDEEVWESVHQRMFEYLRPGTGRGGQEVIENKEKKKAIYAEELRRIVERELILDEMYTRLKKAGKAQVIEEIKEFARGDADRQVREMKKRYKAESDDDFHSILLAQGVTVPVLRRQLERQMMAHEYVRNMLKEKLAVIGLARVRAYYDEHPDEFRTPDRVKWQHIFISANKFATPGEAFDPARAMRAAYDYALAIQKQAAAGADFAALSKRYDHGFAGLKDGTGLGEKRGEIEPKELEPTVWALRPGGVSGLVQTAAGYHIVKVVEREVAGVRPFDDKVQGEARRKVMRDLQEEAYQRLVERLWRGGVVRVMEMP